MTSKFEGKITLDGLKVIMPTNTKLPPKQDWHTHAIWEFNGKRYTPVTPLAQENLDDMVKQIEALGKSKATKPGKLKPTSIRYGILTTGVEPFEFI